MNNMLKLEFIILEYFETYNKLTFSEIIELLSKDDFNIESNDIMLIKTILNNLHVKYKMIERNDILGKESTYQLLDENIRGRSFIDHIYSFNDIDFSDKSIILMSDLHLGNQKYEDYELINKIYQSALMNNINSVIILGDLFDKCLDINEKLICAIDDFDKKFLNMNIPTFALVGNHEKKIKYDFRNIMILKNNFNFINREKMLLQLLNDNIHLSHKFYLNLFNEDVKLKDVNELNDIAKLTGWLCNNDSLFFKPDYKINISGHLHNAFTKVLFDEYMFIGVPSTSKFNYNSCVSYKINIHYDNCSLESFDIIPIYYLDNQLFEGEIINFKIKKSEKTLVKT